MQGENLLIYLINSNFSWNLSEDCREECEPDLIHTVITRPGSRHCENAIICLINSNFWWNVSSLVSSSESALLGYYYKTASTRITWIKTPPHSVVVSLSPTGSVIQLFIFPSLSKLAGLFQSNLKSFRKRGSPAEEKKIIWDRLVRQFLVNGVFSLNNGAQWMFSQTYKEWAWSPSSTQHQKLSQNGTERERERERERWVISVMRGRWCWTANYLLHDRHGWDWINFQRITCLSSSSHSA